MPVAMVQLFVKHLSWDGFKLRRSPIALGCSGQLCAQIPLRVGAIAEKERNHDPIVAV
jgi:hypothetical protein